MTICLLFHPLLHHFPSLHTCLFPQTELTRTGTQNTLDIYALTKANTTSNTLVEMETVSSTPSLSISLAMKGGICRSDSEVYYNFFCAPPPLLPTHPLMRIPWLASTSLLKSFKPTAGMEGG